MQKNNIFIEDTKDGENYLFYQVTDTPLITYQEEMINANKGLKLLPISHRISGDKEYLCYKTTHYTSLKSYQLQHNLSANELLNLINSVLQIIMDAKRYLLYENAFALSIDYIFLNSDDPQQPYLLYLPIAVENPFHEQFVDLIEQLSEEVDYNLTGMGDTIMKLKRGIKTEPNIKKLNEIISGLKQPEPSEPMIPLVKPEHNEPNTSVAAEIPAANATPIVTRPVTFVENNTISPAVEKPGSIIIKPEPSKHQEKEIGGFKIPGGGRSAPIVDKPDVKKKEKSGLFGFGNKKEKDKIDKKVNVKKNKMASFDDRTMIDLQNDENPIFMKNAVLYIVKQGIKTEPIPISKPTFILGRQREDVDYCFQGEISISRIHASVTYNGENYYLTDNESTGGTFINGHKLEKGQSALLNNGDEIMLYRMKLLFEIV